MLQNRPNLKKSVTQSRSVPKTQISGPIPRSATNEPSTTASRSRQFPRGGRKFRPGPSQALGPRSTDILGKPEPGSQGSRTQTDGLAGWGGAPTLSGIR